jgi:hypothetical protein
MKTVLHTLAFFSLASSPVRGQDTPARTEQVPKTLRGDPEPAQVDDTKGSRPDLTDEQKAALTRARQLRGELTDQSIQQFAATDPVLAMLYSDRVGFTNAYEDERDWRNVVDRDILRRTEAKTIFLALLREPRGQFNRFGIMRWLIKNDDVLWAREFMEEAIRLYRLAPADWLDGEAYELCILIRVHGDETHLEFLDFMKRTRGTDGGAGQFIRQGIKAVKRHPVPRQIPGVVPDSGSRQPQVASRATLDQTQQSIPSLSTTALVLTLAAVLGFLSWHFIRSRERNKP